MLIIKLGLMELYGIWKSVDNHHDNRKQKNKKTESSPCENVLTNAVLFHFVHGAEQVIRIDLIKDRWFIVATVFCITNGTR